MTVTDETPLVNATTSQVSGVVGEQQIKDLPLNGRSFDNLITLNPGAVNYSAMKSAGTSTSNGNTFSVDGRRTYENLVLLNGIEYTGSSQLAISPGGVSGELLGIDAIREFNVLDGHLRRRVRKTRRRASERGHSIGNQPVCMARSLSFCATAISTPATFSTKPRFPRFAETSSAARWEGPSRKTSGFCSETMKDSGRRWR